METFSGPDAFVHLRSALKEACGHLLPTLSLPLLAPVLLPLHLEPQNSLQPSLGKKILRL
jgi:hypothetical protein